MACRLAAVSVLPCFTHCSGRAPVAEACRALVNCVLAPPRSEDPKGADRRLTTHAPPEERRAAIACTY